MQIKRKATFALALILTILTPALISCKTTPKAETQKIQIEAEFPNPYDENGNPIVTFETDGSVKMPLWYWLRIIDYTIDVETNAELQK